MGGVNEPAGVVHKGEVVWSQRDVARAGGVEIVEAMRRGLTGYASGGSPGIDPSTRALAAGPDGFNLTFNSKFEVNSEGSSSDRDAGGNKPTEQQVRDSFNAMAGEWAVKQMRPNGVLWLLKNGG